jgi:hypothetical protein
MEALDSVGHRYGVLPSLVIGETHPMKAFAIDLWAHNWGIQRENRDGWYADLVRKHGRR